MILVSESEYARRMCEITPTIRSIMFQNMRFMAYGYQCSGNPRLEKEALRIHEMLDQLEERDEE